MQIILRRSRFSASGNRAIGTPEPDAGYQAFGLAVGRKRDRRGVLRRCAHLSREPSNTAISSVAVLRDTLRTKRNEHPLRALVRSAIRDRGMPPEKSLEIGFELIESARRLHDAAEASLIRGRR